MSSHLNSTGKTGKQVKVNAYGRSQPASLLRELLLCDFVN